MKKCVFNLFGILIIFTNCSTPENTKKEFTYGNFNITKNELADKIKGGWAGQVIGCTYGGPTEFKFNGTMINDYTPIEWNEDLMLWWYENAPGLYDDVYMDLTFVQVFEEEGLDAPAESHAKAFANAEYKLWHANQAARYNILNGIMPPASGYWMNNPHSEDIDFQIEADFAGLMSPGMVNASSEISDRVGHIMNYGDGWYGGVYVAAMYSLAFISNDVEFIVKEGLKAIPEQSTFYQCINDVIKWYETYPDDWKRTWFECQRKWSEDIGCPDGVFRAFNIDAKINAAYIVIGLLYGEGDFGKTVNISTRCGQDSDCNPASAGGILGTVLGYDKIPDYWKQGLDKVEDMDFRYTTISLNDVYEMGTSQALEMITKNGGVVTGDTLLIKTQAPVAVKLEQGFENHFPLQLINLNKTLDMGNDSVTFRFNGKGFVVKGRTHIVKGLPGVDQVVDVFIDGELHETARLPVDFRSRRHDITWKYGLKNAEHEVVMVIKKPKKGYSVGVESCLVYGENKKQNK